MFITPLTSDAKVKHLPQFTIFSILQSILRLISFSQKELVRLSTHFLSVTLTYRSLICVTRDSLFFQISVTHVVKVSHLNESSAMFKPLNNKFRTRLNDTITEPLFCSKMHAIFCDPETISKDNMCFGVMTSDGRWSYFIFNMKIAIWKTKPFTSWISISRQLMQWC